MCYSVVSGVYERYVTSIGDGSGGAIPTIVDIPPLYIVRVGLK